MNNKGILKNEKFKTYYKGLDLGIYRGILSRAIDLYKGESFKNILDIGCGNGLFFDSIRVFGFNVHGIDASDYAVSVCKSKGYMTQKFLLDGTPLPFQDNSFSFVLLNQVLEHLEKADGEFYIKEILRILEPGGVAIINTPSKNNRIWKTDPNHIYCWRPFELLNYVRNLDNVDNLNLVKSYMEPWMLKKYNETTINNWHKNNKHKLFRFISIQIVRVADKIINLICKTDILLSASDINFTKEKKHVQ